MNELQAVKALEISVTDDTLTVDLADGRTLAVPLAWYPRLWHGTPEERQNWRLIGDGIGIHWPDLDEDISIEGLPIRGKPAFVAALAGTASPTLACRQVKLKY